MNETLEILLSRHSVRSYSDRPLDEDVIKKINAEITDINTHGIGMHLQLITSDDEPFKGFTRSYGFFHGVSNYVACIADCSFADWRERLGFYAQKLVIAMVRLGLGTCYVGGTFSAHHVKATMRADWRMPFIIALGHPSEQQPGAVARMSVKFIHRNDLSPREFYDKSSLITYEKGREFFPDLDLALEACACAPSSLNKQPVRIKVVPVMANDDSPFGAYGMAEDGPAEYTLEATVDEANEKNLSDLGIALYNISAVLGRDWEWGNPARLL